MRAGLANVQREAVGVRRYQRSPEKAQETQAQPSEETSEKVRSAEQAKIARYNQILQSEKFLSLTPFQQIVTVASWDITPEQRAPLMVALKSSYRADRALRAQIEAQNKGAAETTGAVFNPQQEIGEAVSFQSRYVTGQYGGTRTSLPGTGFIETSEGIKPIPWKEYTPEQTAAMRAYLQAESLKRSEQLGLFIAAPLFAVAAPVPAAVGAGASVLISAGAKAISGGGAITPEEALMAAGEGAIFSVISGGAMRGLGIAGPGLKAGVGRVVYGTTTGAIIGTAGEYLATGKVTGEGTAYGAAFGFGISAGAELVQAGFGRGVKYFRGKTQKAIDTSYERQIRYNESVLSGKVKGVTELWTPTRSESLSMRLLKVSPKTSFAYQVNVARVPGGEMAYNMAAFQRVGEASDLFEFGFVPKSAMVTENIPVPKTAPYASKFALHPVMASWAEFKADVKTAEFSEEMKQRLIDKGIPESQLAYDYGGETWFQKAPLKMEYAPGKTVEYGWTGPYQQPPRAHKVMKTFDDFGFGAAPVAGVSARDAGKVTQEIIVAKGGAGGAVLSSGGSFSAGGVKAVALMKTGYAPEMWQGTPYYATTRGGIAEIEELTVLSYPASGLKHPRILAASFSSGMAAAFMPRQFEAAFSREALMAAQVQKQKQAQTPLLMPVTVTELAEITELAPAGISGGPSHYASEFRFPGFKFEGGGFESFVPTRRKRGRGKKRTYPILIEEVLGF